MVLLRVCCLVLLAVYLPSIESVAIADPHLRQVAELRPPIGFGNRQFDAVDDVSTPAENPISFFRGAVESPPQLTLNRRLPLRDAVEYRPALDNLEVRNEPYRAAFTKLRDFSYSVFSSQFWIPSQNVDYLRYRFPAYDPSLQYVQSPLHHSRSSYDFPYNQPGYGVVRSGGECGLDGIHIRPNPRDCNGYEICLYGVWTEQFCPEGLHWNGGFGICDWPDSAKCTIASQAPEVSPIVAEEVTSPPAVPTTSAPAPTESAPAITESAPTPTESAPTPTESEITPPKPDSSVITETETNTAVQDTGKKVICYYTNWSWYRRGDGKYAPSDVNLDLCTHIIFGFATLNPSTLLMKVFDSWSDTDEYGPNLYAKVTALRSSGIKVLIALGGWNDSAGGKYSKLVNSPSSRARFVTEAIKFIEQYGFDGLDLDWEYPKCWQVDCNKGPASDKEGFSALVRELRAAFNPKGLLLSAAVSPSKMVIDNAYDVPSISRDLDWIGVMTYDYHGHWDKKTGHVAPMNFHSESEVAYFNANYTLNYWKRLGGDPKKIIMGIPLYGQSFTLTNPSNNGLNAPAKGTGTEGRYTRQGGFLAYYEICKAIQDGGWTVVQDDELAMGPYAYKGNQWVSFDDVNMVQRKSEMVNSMGIGGAMVWALDLDDFRNTCGCESYPLLKTINRVLRNYPAGNKCDITKKTITRHGNDIALAKSSCPENAFKAHEKDCSSYYHCVFGEWNTNTCPNGLVWNKDHCDWSYNTVCDGSSEIITPVVPAPATAPAPWVEEPWRPYIPPAPPSPYPNVTLPDTGYKVICYFTNWAWYRPGEGKYTPDNIDPAMCTHIVYGFAVLDPNNLVLKVHDSWADIDNRFFERVAAYKKKGIKVSVAIGGWNDSLGDKYSRLVNNPEARKRFTETVLQFIEKYGFDGLDLDWEYPKCWQVNCDAGPESDRAAFTAWVRELRAEFTPRGLLLSAAVSPSKKVIDFAYDVASLSHDLDWIGVMTYDYFGNWDKNTGHVAPLYAHSQVENTFFNANFTLNYWMELGADPSKIIMGIPMYGQSFTLANPKENGLNAKARGPGQAGEFTRQGGFLAYYEICKRIQDGGWTVVQDSESAMGPYAYKGDQWTSFDDVSIVRRKAEMVKTMKLGGAMIWALDLDDFRNRCGCEHHPLLRTINRVLREYPVPDPDCKLG